MPSKQETIDSVISTQNYLGSFVKKMITDITEKAHPPTNLKKGDVILLKTRLKPRPGVIIKVTKEHVICIPLTSTENEHCMSESKSRFFKNGCFCNSYEIVPTEMAMLYFLGIYDNNKLLNKAIKELRLFINENI